MSGFRENEPTKNSIGWNSIALAAMQKQSMQSSDNMHIYAVPPHM